MATELFLEKGYAGASMSVLAERCGLQKASLYHHFPSKEALFVACVSEGYGVGIRALEAIRDDDSLSDAERVARIFDALYGIIVESPAGRMSPLIAEVSLRIPDVARAFYDGFIRQQHEIVHAILDAGAARGAFAQVDRLGIEHLVFGPIVNVSLMRQMFAPLPDLDERIPVAAIRDAHRKLVLDLLCAEGRSTAPARRPGKARAEGKAKGEGEGEGLGEG